MLDLEPIKQRAEAADGHNIVKTLEILRYDIPALIAEVERLQDALLSIRIGMEYECACDNHASASCCIQAKEFCCFCITSATLAGKVEPDAD